MNVSYKQCFKVAPDVMARRVGDEVFILSIQRQCYFGLDEVGSRMFGMLSEGASAGETLRQLEQEYSVEPELLRRDFENLVSELAKHQLIEALPNES